MSFGPQRLFPVALAVEDEGAFYGTYPAPSGNYATDPTLVPSADGIDAYNAENPFQINDNLHDLDIQRSTLTERPDIIGRTYWDIGFSFPLQGGTAANAAPRFIDVLTCCGLKGTVVAGTPGSYTIGPADPEDHRSSTMAAEYDGWVHESNGVVGNLVMRCPEPGAPIECAFTGRGLYQDAVTGTFTTVYGSAHASGDQNAEAFYNVSATVTPSGGSAYTLALVSWELNLGNVFGVVLDANDSSSRGIRMFIIARRKPTLSLTMAADQDSAAALTYANIFQHLRAATKHNVAWTYTDLNSRAMAFSFPYLQVRNPRAVSGDGVRHITINYKLTGTLADEFLITQT